MTRSAPRVLGLGGSLRHGSLSLVVLRFALTCAERSGAETKLLTAVELDLPLYDDRADSTTYPENVQILLTQVRRCDALIVCTPVYHGTMSGAVKNILDFLELLADEDRPWLEGKPVGLITVSGGRPRTDAIVSLEIACRALHAWTVPGAVAITESAFDRGVLEDPSIQRRLECLSTTLVGAAGSL